MRAVVVGFTAFASFLIPDMEKMVALTGGVMFSFIGFILPGAFYLKLEPGHWRSRAKLPAVIHVSFGVLVMLVSLGGIFAKWAGVKT